MPKRARRGRGGAGWLCAVLLAACGDSSGPAPGEAPGPARPGPATARWEIVDLMREAARSQAHPSDGAGRVWLDPETPTEVRRASRERFVLHFEVGALGIAPGGAFYLQISPFWGWSTPQVREPEASGFTVVEASDPSLSFGAATLDEQLLIVENTGESAWPAGARFRLDYGAGPAGALTDRYAERGSRFWIAVDGDGDGHREPVPDPPGVDVVAGPAARLRVTAPSVVRPGERFRIALAWLDAADNAGAEFSGDVEWVDPPAGLELPAVRFAAEDGGLRAVEALAREPGLYRLGARAGEHFARSNPIQVDPAAPRVLWADLHGHSALSDGTGTPDDFYRYARDVSALDVAALTDHDHWGLRPLVDAPEAWQRIRESTRRFHEPGRFVTLLGFEWTSWIHGHRHVLWFGDEGAVIDSLAEESDSPEELWSALDTQGATALTFAHHPGGGPVAVNWDVAPDPRYEPVTEIVSVHGSSEAADSPGLIYDPVPGHFARDALDRGYRLGFVGSGDSHDGHPGAYYPDPVLGGVAAILAEEHTREAVLTALRARRCYATNGPRIVLRTALGAAPMGGVLRVAPGEARDESLYVRAVGVAPFERVELVRSGRVVDALALEGRIDVELHREVTELRAGEYLYVRIVQADGGAAWSSPVFIEAEEEAAP